MRLSTHREGFAPQGTEDIIIHRTDGLERPPPEGPSVRYNGFVSSLMAVSASMCRSSLLGKFRVIMRYIVR
jgi:hypothetical protein